MVAFGIDAIPARRVLAATAVLLLHAVLLALLLHAAFSQRQPQATLGEHLYWLTLQPKPKPESPISESRRTQVRAMTRIPAPRLRPLAPGVPAVPSAEALGGLHLNLFDCAPENLANLSPEQRAHCAVTLKKPDNNSVDFADHTNRSHDAARWARALTRKQNPLLLPCASPAGIDPIGTLACLGNGIVNGFDLGALPGYGDAPQVPEHVPNNGDPIDPLKR